MSPFVGLVSLVIGVTVMAKSKFVSLGSMIGGCSSVVILTPLVLTKSWPVEHLIYGIIVAVLILLRHRDNIRNLRAGTERKLGEKGEKR